MANEPLKSDTVVGSPLKANCTCGKPGCKYGQNKDGTWCHTYYPLKQNSGEPKVSNELLKADIMRRMTELVPVMNKLVADIESLPARDRIEVEEKIEKLIEAFQPGDSIEVRTS